MKIKLRGGTEYLIDQAEQARLKELYPRVDVIQELRNMSAWCEANPSRRKTVRGVNRFIVSWLNRSTENPRPKGQFAASHKPFEREVPKPRNKEAAKAGIAALKEAMRK